MDVSAPRISTDSARIGPAGQPDPLLYRSLTEQIIGAALEVHKELGPGFLEKVYQAALTHELTSRNVPSATEAEIPVSYKGRPIGVYYSDILVDGKVICEIKAIDRLTPVHEAQLIHYLKATGIRVGLLVNFGSRSLQFKRMVF